MKPAGGERRERAGVMRHNMPGYLGDRASADQTKLARTPQSGEKRANNRLQSVPVRSYFPNRMHEVFSCRPAAWAKLCRVAPAAKDLADLIF